IVFLGNSLLDTRIDPDYLAELVGKQVTSIATDGSGPGIWFLQLSNVIGAGQHRPDTVFVFFHDDLITRPISFTGPADRALIERLSRPTSNGTVAQSTYDRILGANTLKDRFKTVFASIYPAVDSDSSGQRLIASASAFITGSNRNRVSKTSEQVFSFANKRDQAAVIQQPKFHGAFESVVDGSFLPSLISGANELGLKLVLVRVSARPRDDGTPNEPESLAEYSKQLASYSEGENVRFIDMTGHPGIDAAMYYDGYHLKHRFRSYYTEIFAEWLQTDWVPDQ
ncbi:MAG: hypothetical protein O3B95_09465, partial [Chloroflexi bacterium]|nr:hypothetical protein [Chloroflexota bacterium]